MEFDNGQRFDLDQDPQSFETDLHHDFDKYARHFVANEDRYTENGFFFYQIQSGLEGAPTSSEVEKDLNTLAEAGFLETEEIGSSSKMPNTQYFLSGDERTTIEIYTEEFLDWGEPYLESIRDVIPRTF